MTVPKAGYLGAVYIGSTKIGGSVNWTYSGETRNMQDMDEFEDEYIKQVPLQIVGGDITITGNYLVAEDAGQKELKTAFDAKTPITTIKLATDYTGEIWMTPTEGSHCIVTNANNVGDDKSGIGTFSATLHVNGSLEQIGSTTVMAVETVGAIDPDGGAGTVALWGRLLHRGGLETDIDCYFELSLTDFSAYTNTSNTPTTFAFADDPNKSEFDFTAGGLSPSTTLYYRAVCEDVNENKVYGKVKSIEIPAA